MIRQCFIAKTGIQFYRETFKDIGLDPHTLYPHVLKRPPALSPTPSTVAEVRAAVHAVEATDATLTDNIEVQASPSAASTFETEEDEELADAVMPIYDELKLSKGWWILEYLPIRHHMQNRHDMSWVHYWMYVFYNVLCLLSAAHAGFA
jgi:hypothetical protein